MQWAVNFITNPEGEKDSYLNMKLFIFFPPKVESGISLVSELYRLATCAIAIAYLRAAGKIKFDFETTPLSSSIMFSAAGAPLS